MTWFLKELRRVSQSPLARNTGWIFAGQGTGIVLQAVYFFALARLLGSTEYGVFVGAFAFTGLVSQYGSLGSGTLLLRYVAGDSSAFPRYWGNILLCCAGMGGVLILGLCAFAPYLLNSSSAGLVIFAAVSNCLFAPLIEQTARVFQCFERMKISAILNLLTNLLRTVMVICMLFYMHCATAREWAVASTVVSGSAAATALALVFKLRGRPEFLPSLLARHGLEGFGYSFASSTVSVYNDVDKTMLSHYGMNYANGIYSTAYRVIDMATIPIYSLREAILPRFFRQGRSGVHEAFSMSMRLLKKVLPLSMIIAVVLFVAAPIIPHIAGTGFTESIAALRWLCLIPVLRSIHIMIGTVLTGAGLQHYRTAAQLSAAAFNFGINLWFIPYFGWRGAAWASLLTDAALCLLTWGVLFLVAFSGTKAVSAYGNGYRSKFRIKVGRIARAVESTVRSMWLELCVLVSHSSMVSPEGPVVSLTSYGERVDTVHIAIESIARGAALPSRIILWLDHESAKRGLTRQLQRQVRRGLEIRTCHDFGPHKKYYPYLQSCDSITAPLVTADDDLLYPRWWLKRLIDEWKRYPDLMNCYRVRCMRFEGPELASYNEWELAKCTDPSFRHFAGSGAGIILPAPLQVSMKNAGAGFMDCCPRADDIWMHAQALRAGFMVRQIRTREFRLIEILRSQRQALFVDNLTGGGNDRQVAATYTARDLECLRKCNWQQRPNVPEKAAEPRHEIDYGYPGSD